MTGTSMNRVLLTGASGFIGRHAIQSLLDLGFEVHALYSKNPIQFDSPCICHRVDLMDKKAVNELMAAILPSHLLHLAWIATPGIYWTAPENLDWVEASLHLVRSFIASGGRRLVVSGTCAEYAWNEEVCVENRPNFSPRTLYGASKRSLFLMLESLCKQVGLSFAWGYIFFLYGSHENTKRFVPNVIRGILGGDFVRCSEGTQVRDFLHVQDVASAFAALLNSDLSGGVNIGSGRGVTLKEIASIVAEIAGGSERLQFGAIPTPASEPKLLVPDTSRLYAELGWKPKYELREGLEESVAWWKLQL